MHDSTQGWARYIEELETQAARLPRRRRPMARRGLAAMLLGLLGGLLARLAGRLRASRGRPRPEIDS
jgi:hypothetical protein